MRNALLRKAAHRMGLSKMTNSLSVYFHAWSGFVQRRRALLAQRVATMVHCRPPACLLTLLLLRC